MKLLLILIMGVSNTLFCKDRTHISEMNINVQNVNIYVKESGGTINEKLMIRIGVNNHEKYSKFEHVEAMDFTGKKMRGMLDVLPDGIESDKDLEFWVNTCINFANTLPPKEK